MGTDIPDEEHNRTSFSKEDRDLIHEFVESTGEQGLGDLFNKTTTGMYFNYE